MILKTIKTEEQYEDYLKWIDNQLDKKIALNSPDGEKLQVALLLVKSYEDEHYAIPSPDPIEAVKIKMLEKGLKNKDLVGIIGSKGYISSILNHRKPMTLEIAKIFHHQLGIPAEILLS
jgi:HTH-type transcriptional regulator / antitoxin HigA